MDFSYLKLDIGNWFVDVSECGFYLEGQIIKGGHNIHVFPKSVVIFSTSPDSAAVISGVTSITPV